MTGTIAAPDTMTELDQWLVWRRENGTKVPYRIDGRKASSTDPSTWCSFADAVKTVIKKPALAGIGFVFTKNDPLAGIDLDNCLDHNGNVKEWARLVVETFADTYTEISPSGKGLKIFTRGPLPGNLPGVKVGDGSIEMYDHARYFTVTGRAFRGSPLEIEDHAHDLHSLYIQLTQTRKRWPLQPLDGGRIPCGQRHSTLVSIMGTLRARRVCDQAIEACLQAINERQCEKPVPRDEITRMVQSSRRWGATG